jgi:hypothetical protein
LCNFLGWASPNPKCTLLTSHGSAELYNLPVPCQIISLYWATGEEKGYRDLLRKVRVFLYLCFSPYLMAPNWKQGGRSGNVGNSMF